MRQAHFISHGGGPWPWMQGPMRDAHRTLEVALARLPAELDAPPRAVLVVSAHWEEAVFTVQSAAAPPMLYDYHGFPEETYRIRYPAAGDPALAAHVAGLLREAGLPAALDDARGFDHGAFVPLHVMYPEASVPVVQLSLRQGLDPREHLAAGRALTTLRREGVLILGSGSSYHNLRDRGAEGSAPSAAFDSWLQHTPTRMNGDARSQALLAWQHAPAARTAHPREEHLLPLMVAVGAAEQTNARCTFSEPAMFGYATVSNFSLGS